MLYAILASILVAMLSITGALALGKRGMSSKAHLYVLPFAVGVFLGVVFFELIPETLELSHSFGPTMILIGFLGFYFLSHSLETFHHHHEDEHDECLKLKNGAKKLLFGDAIHNFADGIVIATSFAINPIVGVFTTLGIALHEIPQEIAEFGVLIKSGYTRKKAILYNFISSLSVVLGVLCTFLLTQNFANYTYVFLGIAAGNLLYIASADLIPELHKSHQGHFKKSFLITLLGVVLIFTLTSLAHGS